MFASSESDFKKNYSAHLKHLRMKGLQPKTVSAYSRAIRRIGAYFDYQIVDLSEALLLDYFSSLLESHSWSTVKLDLHGLKFFYAHVLHKPWVAVGLIKPPNAQRLPDIVTVSEARKIFLMAERLSYRVFYFVLYSLGLRLSEGLRLRVADIDAPRLGRLSEGLNTMVQKIKASTEGEAIKLGSETLSLTASASFDGEGKGLGSMANWSVITQQAELEATLKEMDASQELSSMSGKLASLLDKAK